MNKHKFQLVTGKAFTIKCVKCGKDSMSDDGNWYADLNGTPFKDYYCAHCANPIQVLNYVNGEVV
jgi:hypothetical protein